MSILAVQSPRRRKRKIILACDGSGNGNPPASPSLPALTLAWGGGGDDFTPPFTITFPAPEVGDVVTLRRSTYVDFSSYTDASDTIDTVAPVNALVFDFGGAWPGDPQTWYVKAFYTRGAALSFDSNVETFALATPPAGNYFDLEDGTGYNLLLEDGTSYLLQEA